MIFYPMEDRTGKYDVKAFPKTKMSRIHLRKKLAGAVTAFILAASQCLLGFLI
jgi:hypothetical protein